MRDTMNALLCAALLAPGCADGTMAGIHAGPPGAPPLAPPADAGSGFAVDASIAPEPEPGPASCAAIHALDPAAPDGRYEIEIAGAVREVYCDMTGDGGGWTLVVNAPSGGYSEMPIVPVLDPTVHGRLPDDVLVALLTTPATEGNNVRAHAESMVVSLRAVMPPAAPIDPNGPPSDEPPLHYFRIPWDANGPCAVFDEGPDLAAGSPGAWGFVNGSSAGTGSAGSIGFHDAPSGRGPYSGFHFNYDTGTDLTCNRSYTPGGWRPNLPGSLWMR